MIFNLIVIVCLYYISRYFVLLYNYVRFVLHFILYKIYDTYIINIFINVLKCMSTLEIIRNLYDF